MFDFGFEGRDQLTVLSEDGQIKIIVIVCYEDFSGGVDPDSDGIVGDAFPADLPQVHPVVIENFDAVGAVIAHEYFPFVVDDDPVGELEIFRTAELLKDVPGLIENNDSHDFAFDDDYSSLVVDRDASRMLKDVGAEFPDELPVLIVYLDLMGRRSFGDDYVSGGPDHRDSIGIKQLSVAFTAFPELKFKSSLLVEYLNSVIVGVGDDDVVLSVDRDPAGFGKLTLHHPELSELAMVNHFLSFDLRFGRKHGRRHELGSQVQHVLARRYGKVISVLEYVPVRAVAPLLVGIDPVHVEFSNGGSERSQRIDPVESFRDDVGVEKTGRSAGRRSQTVGRVLPVQNVVHGGTSSVHGNGQSVHSVEGTVHLSDTVGRRASDRRLLARPRRHFRIRSHVTESVANPDLNRLEIGNEFEVAGGSVGKINVRIGQTLKFTI